MNWIKKALTGVAIMALSATAVFANISSDISAPLLWRRAGNGYFATIPNVDQICNSSGSDCLDFSGGAGDMLKSVYDIDDNGIVDNSEALGGTGASLFAEKENVYAKLSRVKFVDSSETIQSAIDSTPQPESSTGSYVLMMDSGKFDESVTMTGAWIHLSGFGTLDTAVTDLTIELTDDTVNESTSIQDIGINNVALTLSGTTAEKFITFENIVANPSFTATGTTATGFNSVIVKNSTIVNGYFEDIYISSQHSQWVGFTATGSAVFQHTSGELNGVFTFSGDSEGFLFNDGVLAYPVESNAIVNVYDNAVITLDS
jgi:hypothetical protein